MTLPTRGQREDFEYLRKVLGVLCEISMSDSDELFTPLVERVAHGVFRISFVEDATLMVDSNRRVADDPGLALPEGFPGRLNLSRQYRLTWRDAEGLPMSRTVQAASRQFARHFADAPPNAYVERV